MSVQDVIRLCQQEQSVDNYIERDIIAGLQCINLYNHYKDECTFESSVVQKPTRHWSTEMWKKVIRSDESTFTIFLISGGVHVWRTPREQYRPECLTHVYI